MDSHLNNRAHSEKIIGFQSMDEVTSYYDLLLSKKHVDLYFLSDNFGVKIISFKLETLKKLSLGKKKLQLKTCRKHVTRGCKSPP